MMAGKYHRNFEHYARVQDGKKLAPGQKAVKAYAEGYAAYRSGAVKANPHGPSTDDESDFQSWEYGWQDGERGEPATHVGRPDAVALPPSPPPPPPPLAEIRTHAEMDARAAELGAPLPEIWGELTLIEKRAWLGEDE